MTELIRKNRDTTTDLDKRKFQREQEEKLEKLADQFAKAEKRFRLLIASKSMEEFTIAEIGYPNPYRKLLAFYKGNKPCGYIFICSLSGSICFGTEGECPISGEELENIGFKDANQKKIEISTFIIDKFPPLEKEK